MPTSTALVRPPSPALAQGERSFVPRQALDPARALAQHRSFRTHLEARGYTVEALPPLDEAPDAVFVEDAAIVLEDVAVVPRMGATARRIESHSVREALARHREVLSLDEPTHATLDGGDVLVVDGLLYVGLSARTNHAALKALAHAVLPYGYGVKALEVRGALHLKTGLTYLGNDTLFVQRNWLSLKRLRDHRLIDVPEDEPFGANVLRLGDRLLVPANHPKSAERLVEHGFEVDTLELDELQKAEAGPTCLTLLCEAQRS